MSRPGPGMAVEGAQAAVQASAAVATPAAAGGRTMILQRLGDLMMVITSGYNYGLWL